MHKRSIHEEAVSLRQRGFPYSYISKNTGLSKSTLSDWLSEVPYSPNNETILSIGRSRAAASVKKAFLRQEELRKIRDEATEEIGEVNTRDIFLFGLGLYLGEGAKTHDVTRITNSDPNVILLAIRWFESLGVSREQFFLTIHLYPDSNIEECLQFWSQTTTIPRGQFGKVQIDPRTNKKKSLSGKLPFGTAHLTVRSSGKKEFGVVFARKIRAWLETISRTVIKRG